MSSDLKNVLAKAIMENADEKKTGNSVSQITVGDGNVQVNGDNNKFITTQKHVEKPIVITKPGIEHITESQCAQLTAFVKEIVDLSKLLKKKPLSYQALWSALNKKMNVAQYRLIPHDKFNAALKYLKMRRALLNSMPSAIKKDPDGRNKLYGTIKPIIKKLGMESRLDTLLMEKYSVTSIKDLSDADLKKVRTTVRSWQTTAEKNNKTEG